MPNDSILVHVRRDCERLAHDLKRLPENQATAADIAMLAESLALVAERVNRLLESSGSASPPRGIGGSDIRGPGR